MVGGVLLNTFVAILLMYFWQPRPQGFSLKKIGGAGILVHFFLFYLPLMFGFSAECGCG